MSNGKVSADPAIQGGRPCITGTRITVDAVCGLIEAGFTLDAVLAEYPGLTATDVDAALAYDRAAQP